MNDIRSKRVIVGKHPSQEHVQRCHGDSFASGVDLFGDKLFELPMIACACIQEHGHEEKIDESPDLFFLVVSCAVPRFDQARDSWDAADFKVLPAPVRGNQVVSVGAKVALLRWSDG